ncbi:MAG: cellulase family glycosylhydrolase [Clostridia bacterium]|nr:cellulase family glycosylhydrolase [Clostridia bacterium]MBR2663851.1 cellulase family glycosylhydrolase [Clostridia bacterium]MBR7174614.1 cellulase family glycosylhydrolase [Clostridia bacterium]
MEKIRGVNLGNWLVLEKWMSPELFSGTTAADETYLCLQLSENEKRTRMKTHRDHYITSRDFAYLREKGINAIRLPVPFFVFEDVGPYVSCTEYVDKCMKWANQAGIQVLLDLHTVPGSQNGSDNSGLCGITQWCNHPKRVEMTFDVLERLALRYGQDPALMGIEVLNEPTPSDGAMALQLGGGSIADRYPPVDKEAAKQNASYDWKWLENFYTEGYRRIRKYLPKEKAVVFDDAFDVHHAADWLAKQPFDNVILDTHQYIMVADWILGTEGKDLAAYQQYVKDVFAKEAAYGQSKVPTIVGEWSLYTESEIVKTEDQAVRKAFYRGLAEASIEAFSSCEGWFYWSYKTHLDDPVWDCWDLGKCMSNGWMPENL